MKKMKIKTFFYEKAITFLAKIFQESRIRIYDRLSNNNIDGFPIKKQPILSVGIGKIKFGEKVQIGYFPSPYFFSTYAHIEARGKASCVIFNNNITVNNNFTAIADISEITIGNNVLIGTNVSILDSDFHSTDPNERLIGKYDCNPVTILDNVWIGSNVTILKGVTIGKNSIIANGSIVTKNIPENVIAGGVPATVLKKI